MYRIAGMTFEGALRFEPERIHARIPSEVTEEQIGLLKAAKLIEIINDGEVVASYNLINWAAMENDGDWINMSWFRYSTDRMEGIENRLAEQGLAISEQEITISSHSETLTEHDGELSSHSEALSDNAVELSDILDAITELGDLIALLIPDDNEEE